MTPAEERRYPRLCRGLAIVPTDDTLIVEGAPRRRALLGTAATGLLPRLFPLLDGRHHRSAVCREAGIGDGHLDRVLDLLDDAGLLDPAAGSGTPVHMPDQAMTYLSRTISETGGHRSSDELAAALGGSAVHLVGAPGFGRRVCADLSGGGVATVTFSDGSGRRRPHQDPAEPPVISGLVQAAAALVVVDDGAGAPGELEDAIAAFGELDVPVLRVAHSGDHVEIGPIFLGDYPACGRCLRRSLREPPWDTSIAEPARSGRQRRPTGELDLCAGLVTAEVLAFLTHLTPAPSARVITRLTYETWDTATYLLAPESDCGRCGPGAPARDRGAEEAGRYEWSVAQPPGRLARQPEGSPAYRRYLHGLQTERAWLPTQPRAALPERDPLEDVAGRFGDGGPPNAGARTVDAATLAGILTLVAGRRRDGARPAEFRWSPSGGNMASVQAYVLSEDDPFGLPGTVFRYDDIAHDMRAMHPDHLPLTRLLTGTDLTDTDAAAVIVLTADLPRLARKYQWFAPRLAHLDAGCAATQLAAVARGYGLGLRFASRWDERLGTWFGRPSSEELVTVVAAVLAPGRGLPDWENATEEGAPCR